MNTIKMWHGGRDLEYSYREFKESRKKRWEYGPGLYLTDHYETARKYAKGGGKTYLVELEVSGFIGNKILDIDESFRFINSYVVKSRARQIMEDIDYHMKRVGSVSDVDANVFLNLMINYDAVVGKNTRKLNEFLVSHGIDISYSDRFGGRDETIICVFNNKNIKKIKVISASDVDLNDYNFDILPKLKELEKLEKLSLVEKQDLSNISNMGNGLNLIKKFGM